MGAVQPVGDLLRQWRQRRHLSQLESFYPADPATAEAVRRLADT